MSNGLMVCTRKGLFVLRHAQGRWQVEREAFLGDNVSMALADARDGSWYAALDLGHFGAKLHRSRDFGRSWEEIAVPAFDAHDEVVTGDGKPAQPAALRLVWSLEAGGAAQPGRLWAGTIPGGLFRSDDHGEHWTLMRGLWDRPERRQWFGGGYDHPGIHSVCVDPRNPACVRVAISSGGVWRTDDDGDTWAQTADGMFAAYWPGDQARDPNIQDVHRIAQCRDAPEVFWAQHHNAAYRSPHGGAHWQDLPHVQPSVFGFAVAAHPRDPAIAWFVPAIKDERRYPVDARLVVSRTRDAGATFEVLSSGLPDMPSYDLVYRHGLAVNAGGERLAMGSTTGGLWTSDTQGDHWDMLQARLPPVLALAFVALD